MFVLLVLLLLVVFLHYNQKGTELKRYFKLDFSLYLSIMRTYSYNSNRYVVLKSNICGGQLMSFNFFRCTALHVTYLYYIRN